MRAQKKEKLEKGADEAAEEAGGERGRHDVRNVHIDTYERRHSLHTDMLDMHNVHIEVRTYVHSNVHNGRHDVHNVHTDTYVGTACTQTCSTCTTCTPTDTTCTTCTTTGFQPSPSDRT